MYRHENAAREEPTPLVDELLTPRLTLSPLRPTDTQALHELWTAPGVRRFLWDDEVIPPERTADVVRRSQSLFAERGVGLWGARLIDLASGHEQGKLAGFAGYWFFREPPELELLYGVAEPLWGRGLATELARVMVEYAWTSLGFHEVHASTDFGNAASARVLEKLGFSLTRRAVVGGLDTVFFRLTRA
jgi:ribosomal-protein-alanine N-acetyltransferase